MKKTLFLAIVAGAALAGCVKNEEVAKGSDGSPDRIAFEAPVVSVPVRATEIADNYPTDADFAVYALYHENRFSTYTAGTLYMKDVQCTYKHHGVGVPTGSAAPTDYWVPTTAYYWPKNGYLTFAAYAPAKTTANSGTNGVWSGNDNDIEWDNQGFKFNNFQVKNTPSDQIDLLYSDRAFDKKQGDEVTDDPNPYDGIQIKFNHALSSIVFTARALTENAIKLTGIKVNNIYSKASFAQGLTFTPSTSGGTGQDNASNQATWSGHSGLIASPYVVYATANPQILTTDADANATDKQPVYVYENTIVNNLTTTGGTRKSSLIVLPQNLSAADRTTANGYTVGTDGAKDATVTVTYQIKHGSEWLDQESTFKLAVTNTPNPSYVWEMGKRYVYNITIGLYEIYFSPKVTDWVDEGGALIE